MENLPADSQIVSQRAKIFGRVTAVLLAAIGLYVIFGMIAPIYRTLSDEDMVSHIFFLFVFPIPMIVFGGYCLFVAYHMWLSISAKTIRQISLVIAIILFMIIGGGLHSIIEDSTWTQPIASLSVTMLITAIVLILAGLFYVLCKRLLLNWLSLQEVIDWSQREKSVRRFWGWVAFFVWMASANMIMDLLPKDPEYTHVPEKDWWAFMPLLAIPPIYLAYRLAVRIALRKKPAESASKLMS